MRELSIFRRILPMDYFIYEKKKPQNIQNLSSFSRLRFSCRRNLKLFWGMEGSNFT